jgi:ATP phosphoribosyltransferase regulatory subunit
MAGPQGNSTDPMSEEAHKALLPAGLRDLLPPKAQQDAELRERLLARLAAAGYELVRPPLVEFEDSLLSGSGAAMAGHSFRLMDPVSQRMMAVRADMTLQVARIATTRLADAARPLRLSYAGDVLRVKGSQLRPERQFTQVGAELIGSDAAEADAEAVLLAAEALEAVGAAGLSVDLNSPTLVEELCRELAVEPRAARRLRAALDRKNRAEVEAVGSKAAALCGALLDAVGTAETGLKKLAAVKLPPSAAAEAKRLAEVARLVREAAPALMLTIDPVEYRGFEYQTGVSFTLFARDVRGELGRGGRYRAGNGTAGKNGGEPATGFTLFLDSISRAVPEPAPQRRLFLPHGVPAADAQRLRAEGWIALAGLAPVADARKEARRLGCTHLYVKGKIEEIG